MKTFIYKLEKCLIVLAAIAEICSLVLVFTGNLYESIKWFFVGLAIIVCFWGIIYFKPKDKIERQYDESLQEGKQLQYKELTIKNVTINNIDGNITINYESP